MSSLTSACFSHPNSSVIIFFFVATAYRFSKVFRKKSSSVGTAFVLHYPWSVIHSSVETATATETLQQVELHPGKTASTEKSKNLLLSEQQLVFAWNAIYFESRGKKQILEVPFLHCAAQLFGASLISSSLVIFLFYKFIVGSLSESIVRLLPVKGLVT